MSNIQEKLSRGVGDFGAVLVDLADDAGDERSCQKAERRSAASRREGSMSGIMHAHDGSLAGRVVWWLALSRAVLLEW